MTRVPCAAVTASLGAECTEWTGSSGGSSDNSASMGLRNPDQWVLVVEVHYHHLQDL